MNARPPQGALLVFVGIVIALLVACDSAASTSEALSAAEAPLVERAGVLYLDEPDRLLLGRVDHVIDGDTLDVSFDGKTERVRVFGIAAAERDQRCYLEATDELRALAGSEVRVLPDDRREDNFGRWLRYLFTPDGRSIDAALVASGAVEAWRDDGAYRDDLVILEQEARVADVFGTSLPPSEYREVDAETTPPAGRPSLEGRTHNDGIPRRTHREAPSADTSRRSGGARESMG